MWPISAYFVAVFIVREYNVETRPDGMKEIRSRARPPCPDCGGLLSGYDRRRRQLIGEDGCAAVYLLRRFRCSECGRLHLEMPDIMQPQKHYAAALISQTVAGAVDYCPADNSTIRRWKKK